MFLIPLSLPGTISNNGFVAAILLSIYVIRSQVLFSFYWDLSIIHPSTSYEKRDWIRRIAIIWVVCLWPWDSIKTILQTIFN